MPTLKLFFRESLVYAPIGVLFGAITGSAELGLGLYFVGMLSAAYYLSRPK